VAVAEELSFTRAAQRLHLSQPALSKQIRGLETALRAQLLHRDRRRVELTSAGQALLGAARGLLEAWDEAMAAVADAAAQESHLLRVGTLTSIGRALYPGVVDHFAKRQAGWRVELRSFGWGDPTAGLHDQTTDVAFLWLPIDAGDVDHEVLVTERRFVALSTKHRLAAHRTVTFADIADEPFVALPESAGSLRDFWLALDERDGTPARVAAEVTSADETFEIVASGAAVVLLAEGNAVIYARPGIACLPVTGLGAARLAVAWRRDDRRLAVAAFVQACLDAVADVGGEGEPQYPRGEDARQRGRGTKPTPGGRPTAISSDADLAAGDG
jgi:DNA-binding transcriptional LysR family regulator